jgi:hypothetical protein
MEFSPLRFTFGGLFPAIAEGSKSIDESNQIVLTPIHPPVVICFLLLIFVRPERSQPTRDPACQLRFIWRPYQSMAIDMSTELNIFFGLDAILQQFLSQKHRLSVGAKKVVENIVKAKKEV